MPKIQEVEDNGMLPGWSEWPEVAETTLSKKGFAEHLGVVPGRISQLIEKGLPVLPNGRIDVSTGVAWYRANVDPNRRRGDGGLAMTPRAQRELANAKIANLKADKLAGELIDRKAALAAIEARARMERDAWLGWSRRIAPEIAQATGGELSAVTAMLDRLVRDQLASLAEMPAPMRASDD